MDVFPTLKDESINLIFADPPWNVGKEYYVVQDDRHDYLEWCEHWIKECFRVLKTNGSFYLINTLENSYELYFIMKKYGLFQTTIIWFKRVNPTPLKNGFPNIFSPILFFTKSKLFYFDSLNRIDFELKSKGDCITHQLYNVWLDIPKVVSGIFSDEAILDKEQKMVLPNQLPIKLLERIIKCSCPNNGIVLDPFAGTGTTLEASIKLSRNCVGIEIDPKLCCTIKERVFSKRFLNKFIHHEFKEFVE